MIFDNISGSEIRSRTNAAVSSWPFLSRVCERQSAALAPGGLELVAAVVLENNGTLGVVTKDKLGSGSALDGVPGWSSESG